MSKRDENMYYMVFEMHHYESHCWDIIELPKYSEEIKELIEAIVKQVDDEHYLSYVISGEMIIGEDYYSSVFDFCNDHSCGISVLVKYSLEKLDELLNR